MEDIFEVCGLKMLPYRLGPGGEIDTGLLSDVLSIRVMFLRWTGEQAALRSSGADLDAVRETVDALAAADTPEVRAASPGACPVRQTTAIASAASIGGPSRRPVPP